MAAPLAPSEAPAPGGILPTDATQTNEAAQPIDAGQAAVIAKQAAPEIAPQSALAVGSQGGDIQGRAQVVGASVLHAHAAKATSNVFQHVGDDLLGWLHDAGVDVEHVAGDALSGGLKVLNMPLQFVQHEYRYFHDVEARHGMGVALAALIGVTAGAALGAVVTAPAAEEGGAGPLEGAGVVSGLLDWAAGSSLTGPVLGAETAAGIEGQTLYRDSWQRTADGTTYRDPHTGDVVSMGRDVASLLGLKPNTPAFGTLSGVLDGVGDLVMDPLSNVGHIAGAARSLEGAPGVFRKLWGGTSLTDPEVLDRQYDQYASFRRAVGSIADGDAATIAKNFPKMAPIAGQLGKAETPEQVLQVLKDVTKAGALSQTFDRIPTQSFVSLGFEKLRTAAANYEGPLAENPLFGPARWTRRLTNLPGATYDPIERKFTGNVIDPRNTSGIVDLYRMVRYSQNENVADMVVNAYTYASPGDRVRIFRNAIMDTVGAMAHFDLPPAAIMGDPAAYERAMEELLDPDARKAMKEWLDMLTGSANPNTDGVYGMDIAGHPISRTWDPITQRWFGAGILQNQTGKMVLPHFRAVRSMAKELAGARDVLGHLDDFVYAHATQGFFKPLVLLSGSYASHIALAELIPNALRRGAVNLYMGAYHSALAKLGYKAADAGEDHAFLGWIYRQLDGLPHNQERAELHAAVAALTDGHMVSTALAAGENYSREAVSPTEWMTNLMRRNVAQMPVTMRRTKDFATFGPGDKNFLTYWQDWSREVSRDRPSVQAARAYRAAAVRGASEEQAMSVAGKAAAREIALMPREERELFVRSKLFSSDSPPKGMSPTEDWGNQVAKNMRAALGQKPLASTEHAAVLDAIRRGDAPAMHELEAIPKEDHPVAVKGRVEVPDGSSAVQRIAGAGFRHIINPMVNFLSREPIFNDAVWEQYRQLLPKVRRGELGFDEAVTASVDRATNDVMKYVHNLHDRTQWSDTVRNWFPFYFAQEQAYKRMGRLLATDPGAFRRYQMMISGLSNIVAKQQDSQGNTYYSIPGAGWLGQGVPRMLAAIGVPLAGVDTGGFTANLSSANVIFPLSSGFRPDQSPLATIAAKSLTALFPEMIPATEAVTGSQALNSQLWTLLVPNTLVQRSIQALEGPSDRSFASAMMQTMQALDFEQRQAMRRWVSGGQKGPMPDIVPPNNASTAQKQAFVDRVKNQTRIMFITRALLGFVSPLAPEVSVKNWNLPAELSADISKAGSVSKGMQEFLAKNPDATPYTVFQSKSVSGASIPDSAQAQAWIDTNRGLIDRFPYATPWLIPRLNDTKYDPAVYDEQLAMGLRTKDTPQEFLDSLYVAAGNESYFAALAVHEKNLASGAVNKGQEYTDWDNYLNSLEKAAPTWAASYLSGDRTVQAQQAIAQLQQIRQQGLTPDNPQARMVMGLLSGYETAEAEYTQASASSNYSSQEAKVKDSWRAYLESVKVSYPALTTVIDTVFINSLGKV